MKITKKITKGQAISSLVPGAEFVVVNNSEIRWMSKDKTQPSEDAIANEVTRLQAIQDYQEPRLRSYPSLNEQMDLLFKAIDSDDTLKSKFSAFHSAIESVKKANPKP